MLWLLPSLLLALVDSLKDIFNKHALKSTNEYLVAWALFALALPFLLPTLLFVPTPTLDATFWGMLVVVSGLNATAFILYVKALKASDISLTAPINTLAPGIMLLTSPLLLGEFPSVVGLFGVLLMILGAYTLQIKERHNGFLRPFQALFHERGPRLMFLVVCIWSVAANLDKIGVRHSSPLWWAAANALTIAIILTPLVFKKVEHPVRQLKKKWRSLLVVGLLFGLVLILQMTAIQMTLVIYVSSIKRLGTLLTVILGVVLFKEKGFKERFIGAGIMVLGALLIGLS